MRSILGLVVGLLLSGACQSNPPPKPGEVLRPATHPATVELQWVRDYPTWQAEYSLAGSTAWSIDGLVAILATLPKGTSVVDVSYSGPFAVGGSGPTWALDRPYALNDLELLTVLDLRELTFRVKGAWWWDVYSAGEWTREPLKDEPESDDALGGTFDYPGLLREGKGLARVLLEQRGSAGEETVETGIAWRRLAVWVETVELVLSTGKNATGNSKGRSTYPR